MSALLLITSALQPSAEVLPGLALLSHTVKIVPAQGSALLDAPDSDLILVDGRQDLAAARDLCRLIRTTGADAPVLLVVTEGGLAVVAHDWGMDDVVLHTCGPAELDARIRLAIGRASAAVPDDPAAHVIHRGEVLVDDATYTARIGGRPLDLTYKEFELLKYLAQHPGRVFSREQLLQEVWGYDYFGGTRTVDVHVRRLRAKLGTEHEHHIGTVRNVGYRFVVPTRDQDAPRRAGRAPRSCSETWPEPGEGPRDMSRTTSPLGSSAAASDRCTRARLAGQTYVMRPRRRLRSPRPPRTASIARGQLLAAGLAQARRSTPSCVGADSPRSSGSRASTSPQPGTPTWPDRAAPGRRRSTPSRSGARTSSPRSTAPGRGHRDRRVQSTSARRLGPAASRRRTASRIHRARAAWGRPGHGANLSSPPRVRLEAAAVRDEVDPTDRGPT